MAFSVKSERADALLEELRTLTHEGITEAVTRSLEERLARQKAATINVQEVLHTLWETYPQLRRQPSEFSTSTNFNDWMYDEHGLPK